MNKALMSQFIVIFRSFSVILFLGFISTAVAGIVLKTSAYMLQLSMKVVFEGYDGDADNLRHFEALVLEISDTMAIYCIVVGVVLATLTLVCLIASYLGWHKALKMYTIVLGVLLVVQAVVVVMFSSNPTKYANGFVSSTEALLKFYGGKSDEGNASTVMWNVLMEAYPKCCGMDGYGDFEELGKGLPLPCCNITSGYCNATTAQSAGMAGCRHKVELCSVLRSAILLRISILLMCLQALRIIFLVLLICTAEDEKTAEDGRQL